MNKILTGLTALMLVAFSANPVAAATTTNATLLHNQTTIAAVSSATTKSAASVTTSTGEPISNGIYTLTNDVYHDHPVGMASSRMYLEPEMGVTLQNKQLTYTLHFVASEYIQNYRINVNGEAVAMTLDESAERISIDFVAASQADEISVMMYIEPMGRDVEFQVLPLWDNLVLVQALPDDQPQTNYAHLAVGGLTLSGAAGGVLVWRKRKGSSSHE